jgi:hypothetical protein
MKTPVERSCLHLLHHLFLFVTCAHCVAGGVMGLVGAASKLKLSRNSETPCIIGQGSPQLSHLESTHQFFPSPAHAHRSSCCCFAILTCELTSPTQVTWAGCLVVRTSCRCFCQRKPRPFSSISFAAARDASATWTGFSAWYAPSLHALLRCVVGHAHGALC